MKVKSKTENEKDKMQNYQSINYKEKHLLMKGKLCV